MPWRTASAGLDGVEGSLKMWTAPVGSSSSTTSVKVRPVSTPRRYRAGRALVMSRADRLPRRERQPRDGQRLAHARDLPLLRGVRRQLAPGGWGIVAPPGVGV